MYAAFCRLKLLCSVGQTSLERWHWKGLARALFERKTVAFEPPTESDLVVSWTSFEGRSVAQWGWLVVRRIPVAVLGQLALRQLPQLFIWRFPQTSTLLPLLAATNCPQSLIGLRFDCGCYLEGQLSCVNCWRTSTDATIVVLLRPLPQQLATRVPPVHSC